jgi:hypothetical protein
MAGVLDEQSRTPDPEPYLNGSATLQIFVCVRNPAGKKSLFLKTPLQVAEVGGRVEPSS